MKIFIIDPRPGLRYPEKGWVQCRDKKTWWTSSHSKNKLHNPGFKLKFNQILALTCFPITPKQTQIFVVNIKVKLYLPVSNYFMIKKHILSYKENNQIIYLSPAILGNIPIPSIHINKILVYWIKEKSPIRGRRYISRA